MTLDRARLTDHSTSRSIKLVHTSDVHLGCEFTEAEAAARAFRAVIDLALATEADGILIPGDLVDWNGVDDSIVAFMVNELTRFGRHSFVLPGNHDAYDGRSIYRRPTWINRPSFIHLVDSTNGERCIIPELELEVWGRPTVEHMRTFEPLVDIPPRGDVRWRIAMAHGHLELPGEDKRSSPIFPAHIAAADCDYVALGHWDRQVDVSQAGVTAHYSGAPHGSLGLATVLVVTLDTVSGVSVESAALRGPAPDKRRADPMLLQSPTPIDRSSSDA